MQGRVCLVTGATNGLGFVSARVLAERGAHVIAVGRDAERTQRAVQEIRGRTGNAAVDGLTADLSSQRDVRALAQQVIARYPALHVLLNNAGAMFFQRQLSADGIEMTFALNHLGYFLLTELLLPLLTASGAPGRAARIVNVSSEAHRRARIDFDDLESARRYVPFLVYSRSKLENILFTYELARRLAASPAAERVTTNTLHPGVVASGFYGRRRGVIRAAYPIFRLFLISSERGARTQTYLSSSPAVEGVTGRYFVKERERRSAPASYDVESARRLWEISERLAPTS